MDTILIELLDLLDSQTWIPVETQEQISALREKALKVKAAQAYTPSN